MSRDGTVSSASEPLMRYFPFSGVSPEADATWTGKALVVISDDYARKTIVARTFDDQFRLIDDRVLLEDDNGGTVVGAASDGLTAIVVYRHDWYELGRTFYSVFSRDGYLLNNGTLAEGTHYETVAAGANGYMITGPSTPQGFWQGVMVDSRGNFLRPVAPFQFASSSGIRFDRPVLWDGSGFVMLHLGLGEKYSTHLERARFDASGTMVEAPADLRTWPETFGPVELPVTALSGSTVGMALRMRPSPGTSATPLEVRVAPSTSSLFSVTPTPMPPGAAPRVTPAAAANANAVLVAWREQPAAGRLEVGATLLHPDGTPTNALFALGGGSCDDLTPAVATDGRGFLVAYSTPTAVMAALVRADGSVRAAQRVGGLMACGNNIQVASNGSQYLAVWTNVNAFNRLQVYGARIASDGTLLDEGPPILIGSPADMGATRAEVRVASNGADYLVAWDNFAARVTAAGKVLDLPEALSLGTGSARAVWFNGRTYVVAVVNAGYYRFYRIGADGKGAHSFSGPAPATFLFYDVAFAAVPACDAGGCLSLTSSGIRRITDRGDAFEVTMEPTNLDMSTAKGPLLVYGSRPLAIYARGATTAPYANASAIFVRAWTAGRQRSARH